MQAHFSADPRQGSGQKMGSAHPGFERSKGVLNGLLAANVGAVTRIPSHNRPFCRHKLEFFGTKRVDVLTKAHIKSH